MLLKIKKAAKATLDNAMKVRDRESYLGKARATISG
jgi:hypothetical protein